MVRYNYSFQIKEIEQKIRRLKECSRVAEFFSPKFGPKLFIN